MTVVETYTETITPEWTTHPTIITETRTETITLPPIIPTEGTFHFTEPNGQTNTDTVTLTPQIETETYTVHVTPVWTSIPETVTVYTYTEVMPRISTETYTTTETYDHHSYRETWITPVTITPSVEI
jgi:hypothetical protein